MVLVVEGELPDLVNLRVVLTAEGQHLHSFVNDLLPIPACPDMVQMVQVGVPAADAALLRHQAGLQAHTRLIGALDRENIWSAVSCKSSVRNLIFRYSFVGSSPIPVNLEMSFRSA